MRKKKKFINPFSIPAVRKKILIITGILLLIRIINQIPTPGVNTAFLKEMFEASGNTWNFLNMMTGGSLSSMSVLALNITPYITASIILELLSVVFKSLEEMKRDGKTGQEKFKKITLMTAVGLSLVEALAMAIGFGRRGMLINFTWYWVLAVTITWTIGSGALSFVGTKMTDKKLGNGISLILLCNILSSVIGDLTTTWDLLTTGVSIPVGALKIMAAVLILFFMTLFVVYLQAGRKEIPVIYSKKTGTGSGIAQRSTLPIPVVAASVIPVIFASSLFSIPSMIGLFVDSSNKVWNTILGFTNTSYWFNPHQFYYTVGWIVFAALIIFFTYFYTSINFNPIEVADNLRKNGGQIPGVRPGKETERYISKRMAYLSLFGGVGMVIVATVPMVISGLFGIGNISLLGTSVVIIVGVFVETTDKLSADMNAYRVNRFI